MKEFDFNVNITETQIIEYAVSVEAESLEEAKQKAQDKELYREIDMMLIGQLIEILKQYDSDREVMIHTLKGENVEVNGYFIPKNLDESIFYLTDLDVIPRN